MPNPFSWIQDSQYYNKDDTALSLHLQLYQIILLLIPIEQDFPQTEKFRYKTILRILECIKHRSYQISPDILSWLNICKKQRFWRIRHRKHVRVLFVLTSNFRPKNSADGFKIGQRDRPKFSDCQPRNCLYIKIASQHLVNFVLRQLSVFTAKSWSFGLCHHWLASALSDQTPLSKSSHRYYLKSRWVVD